MIRSTIEELGEYQLIRHPEHIAQVWSVIEGSLSRYWKQFVDSERQPDRVAELAAKFGNPIKQKVEAESAVLCRVFEKAVSSYEAEAKKYRAFFEPEVLEEYQDDPMAFKHGLSREVPVIAHTLRQRNAELKEWQADFRSARANDLLQVFSNVLDFQADWSETHPRQEYATLDDPASFDLDPLDDDETMYLVNVVGMGIKSIVLYHLDPERLPARGRHGLYGLFFLSDKKHFGLPSESSEFLMINDVSPVSDGSLVMDQNYWYPYGLFSLYALRIFRWMDCQSRACGYQLDTSVRFVYVERFFEAVCSQHAEDMPTMRAHERFEAPG